MRRIINGKSYNTETATVVGEHSVGMYSDFEHYEETLYRKKTGEFFLVGDGGPMSPYSKQAEGSDGIVGAVGIIPMSEDDAKAWMEKHGTADEYEACFGPVEE